MFNTIQADKTNGRRRPRIKSSISITESKSFKAEQSSKLRKLAKILRKDIKDRNEDDKRLISESPLLLELVEKRVNRTKLEKERCIEKEDPIEVLEHKCNLFAQALVKSKYLVFYTGAGISTSAQIPDYRGPNGIWTQLTKTGYIINKPIKDLALAEPTFTHMALVQLCKMGIAKHIVSQNCDGLHLRSGIPQDKLSEIHGNMFIEICNICKNIYYRDFDVTEKTGLHRHKTGRKCSRCIENGDLVDTIVHFGEKSRWDIPMNWLTAARAAKEADTIICLGSSLKILRRYPCLWPKKQGNRPSIIIVNLQWTPKDSQASLKINGKCDEVMKIVTQKLSIHVEEYNKTMDPLFDMHIPLRKDEEKTCSRTKIFDSNEEESQESLQTTPGWFGKGLRVKK